MAGGRSHLGVVGIGAAILSLAVVALLVLEWRAQTASATDSNDVK